MKKTISFFLLICALSTYGQRSGDRPNIIFILTDDQRWDALGFAGNEIIHTPEMDRLAGEGVYFKNAFVTTPICAASRASIMTGLYERTHDFTFGTPPMEEKYVNMSYPALLKSNGYKTGFVGKFGMRWASKMDTATFDYYERPGEQFWATTYYRLNSDHTGHQHLTSRLGDRSIEFLEKYKDEPFCLSLSFHAPHAEDVDPRQYIYPLELDSLYQDIDIPDPIMSSEADFMAQPTWVREGLSRVRWYWRFDTPEKYQRMVKGYYRMITGIDIQLGRLRAKLEELGIADNTVIMLLGDNGYFLGERQFAGKWLMYENSLRVPFVLYDPRTPDHRVIEDMALNIDVAPTILDLAGAQVPDEMQGKSLTSFLSAEAPGFVRRDFLCEHLFDNKRIPKSEGIRTKDWKYFRYVDHPEHEELYNVANDSLERYNLAADERFDYMLQGLRDRLEVLIEETKGFGER